MRVNLGQFSDNIVGFRKMQINFNEYSKLLGGFGNGSSSAFCVSSNALLFTKGLNFA